MRPVRRLLVLLSLVAMVSIAAGCIRTAPNAPNAMARLLELVNKSRADYGLAPLQECAPLANAALAHSQDMAAHNFFDHTGSDGSQSWDRAIRYGYGSMLVQENIGFRYPSVEGVFLGWMDSPGHRENILEPTHQHAGFAWVGGYWTAVLGSGGTC